MNTELPLILEGAEANSLTAFRSQLLAEACLAVAGDMECYDYQIGRLIRKVEQATHDTPEWTRDKGHLLSLVRFAATGFGGRREKVWLASFESSLDPVSPWDAEG